MKHKILLATLLGLCAPVLAGDLKPGLWQINTTMEGDNLPPQMRAHTQQQCLTPEEAEDVVSALQESWNADECDLGKVDRSGDNLTWEASCNQNGMQSTMKAVDLSAPEKDCFTAHQSDLWRCGLADLKQWRMLCLTPKTHRS